MRTHLIFGFAIASMAASLAFASNGGAAVSRIHDEDEMELLQTYNPNLASEHYAATILAPTLSADRNYDGLGLQDIHTQKKQLDASWRAAGVAEVTRHDFNKDLSYLTQVTFNRFETDGDTTLSTAEYEPVPTWKQAETEVERMRDAGCSYPKPGPKTRIVGYSAYEGDTISSSYVGDPDDVTYVIDVQIERGNQPLYLLFTSYEPVIWRLRGDVGRVERIVASSQHTGGPENRVNPNHVSAVGVMGVTKSKISITSQDCLTDIHAMQNWETGVGQESAEAWITTIIDRSPDDLFGEYAPYGVALPSGTVFPAPPRANKVPNGFNREVWQDAAQFWSGGLATINPDEVVAAVPVAPYIVLPAEMGLSQLVGQGAARKLERGRYLLLRDIDRIPPGMGGAHSAVLVLDDGVKHPPGKPVHGCVVTLAEAAKWSGPHICHELKKMPEPVPTRKNR